MDSQSYWTPVGDAFARYLITCGKSPETKRTYMASLRIFWRWCAGRQLEPFCAQRPDVRAWMGERLQSVSATRANADLMALRLFYAWLIENAERNDNPTEDVRVRRQRRAPTRPFSVAEMAQLLAACEIERDRLIILTLAHTGLRISELVGLTTESFDWERGYIVVRGKGDKERLVAPPAALMGRLRAFVGMFPSGPLWRSRRRSKGALAAQAVRNILYGIGERAKVDDVHPHRFRAMFGTEFLASVPDIQALQYLMGHESIETTARYTWYTREERAQAAMRKLNLGDTLTA